MNKFSIGKTSSKPAAHTTALVVFTTNKIRSLIFNNLISVDSFGYRVLPFGSMRLNMFYNNKYKRSVESLTSEGLHLPANARVQAEVGSQVNELLQVA